ncbi:helix-turn-helix domain-containing protein [Agaribacterium sp. ZY112]|uniref:helix-turn-helix domain-containing protein n=1 Tax=Agaribacterium sp. ZY112 TaxID=3233574 RepID=UPI00352349C4
MSISTPIIYQPFQPTLSKAGLTKYGLDYQHTKPCAVLRPYIHSYLQISTTKATPYPIAADATQALFFSKNGVFFGGTQYAASELLLPEAGAYLGVHFYPGALRHFFKVNLQEVSGTYVDVNFLGCAKLAQLHHELFSHNSIIKRFHSLEQNLLAQFQPLKTDVIDFCLQQVFRFSSELRVQQLAQQAGLSSRHLNRKLTQATGLTSKRLLQTIKTQIAAKHFFQQTSSTAELANQHGFYDQAHYINAFKSSFGLSPHNLRHSLMSDFSNP